MGKGLPVTRTIVFSEEAMVTTCEGQWLGCNELTIDERRFKAKVVGRQEVSRERKLSVQGWTITGFMKPHFILVNCEGFLK